MSIFRSVFYGFTTAVVGLMLINNFNGIMCTIGYMVCIAAILCLCVPTYVVARTIKKNGFQFKSWKPSMRKLGYIVVLTLCYECVTDPDGVISEIWWGKLIFIGLALSTVYTFLVVNNKEEEHKMYDDILGDNKPQDVE